MGKEIKVASKGDIDPGKGILVNSEGKNIAIFNIDGEYFAIDDECSHAGGSLAEGDISGHTVMCPLHGAEFDIKTGQAVSEPAENPVGNYKVTVKDDDLFIEI